MSSQTKYAEPGERPPPNTKRIYRWGDLPGQVTPARYRVHDETSGETQDFTVSGHKRQVLEGIMRGPIMAASYCRLSDQILPLRRDKSVPIICTIYRNDADTGREKFGVYTLEARVTRVAESEVAA